MTDEFASDHGNVCVLLSQLVSEGLTDTGLWGASIVDPQGRSRLRNWLFCDCGKWTKNMEGVDEVGGASG